MFKYESLNGLINTNGISNSYYVNEMYNKNENPFSHNISCCNNNHKINVDDIKMFFIKNNINKIDKII